MNWKIDFLTLHITPKVSVNLYEFYADLLKSLGLFSALLNGDFIEVVGSRYFSHVVKYNGIYIKIPSQKTIKELGFVLEITQHGLEFLADHFDCSPFVLIPSLFDRLIFADVKVLRLDVETDYIPQKIYRHLPYNCLNSELPVIIGSRSSSFYGYYYGDTTIYSSRNKIAAFMADEILCCNTPDDFETSLKDFLYRWRPCRFSSRSIISDNK